MQHRFHLQEVEAGAGLRRPERGQQQQIAHGVENGGLHIGEEGVAGVGVRIPDRQAPGQHLPLEELAERQKVMGEVAVGKGAQTEQDRQVEERG
jgi:hypothetical protein